MEMFIRLTLKSDATFGLGEGVAGLVDEEIEHDFETGLPFLRGRTLKGLLVEECSNILYSLERQNNGALAKIKSAAKFLFGCPGSTIGDLAGMHVGPARLPPELRWAVETQINQKKLTAAEVIDSLTSIRYQTAVNEGTGAPEKGSLRSLRVVLRDISFTAALTFDDEPKQCAKGLLAGCALSLRRAGVGRNRGRGRLKARLLNDKNEDVTQKYFSYFQETIGGEQT
jgi:hypothetical protein